VKSEDSLWDTGKEEGSSTSSIEEEKSILDLSETAPEKNNEEINLESPKETKEENEDWAIPLAEDVGDLNLKTIVVVGTIVILLLTGTLFVLLNENIKNITVPNEKYNEQINYDVNGFVTFDSNLDIPIPFGIFENDVVINNLDINFNGDLSLGIDRPEHVIKNGYGETKSSVFKKYIEQNLDDVDGTITEEGSEPLILENSKIVSTQEQYIDSGALKIIRSDIISNTSTAKISGIGQKWAWQSATDWIPREHKNGILPHGNSYIGKTLSVGDKSVLEEGGIQLNTKVVSGEKIKGYDTVIMVIQTSHQSELGLGYEYDYSYMLKLYMSEISSLPLKFELYIDSQAKSPGSQLYSIDLRYTAIAKDIFKGSEPIPTKGYDSSSDNHQGEFLEWDNGAPAFGTACNENSQLNQDFSLQTGISAAKENISSFDIYIKDQEAKSISSSNDEYAFVIEAKYNTTTEAKWNFTMAHNDEESRKIDGWTISYNSTSITGNENEVNNPILKMEEIKSPLTLCSAESLMTGFEGIADWSIDKDTNNVNYEKTTLILGQNLISKQSLSAPSSILDFGNLDLLSILGDLNSGNLDFNDYSNNIDVDTAGSYAYFLDKNGESESLGYDYQEVAGIDAKNGLVMFNLQSRSSL